MPPAALGLLFLSAILHTAWNLLLKQAGEKYMAVWWAVLIGSAAFLPALFFTGLPARQTWMLLIISVLVEAAYYIVLSAAYNDSDFSLVYPLGRGAAPALIAVWSVVFLRERLTAGGLLGLLVIILGLLIVGAGNLIRAMSDARGRQSPHLRAVLLALLLALLISIYSVIDGAAVKQTGALAYATLVFFLSPILTTPLILRRYGWPRLRAELAAHRLRLIGIGILTVTSYLMALLAYSIARVSYSGAIREVSVVLGAFAGWRFLGEKLGGVRLFGALIIFSGIVVMTMFG